MRGSDKYHNRPLVTQLRTRPQFINKGQSIANTPNTGPTPFPAPGDNQIRTTPRTCPDLPKNGKTIALAHLC